MHLKHKRSQRANDIMGRVNCALEARTEAEISKRRLHPGSNTSKVSRITRIFAFILPALSCGCTALTYRVSSHCRGSSSVRFERHSANCVTSRLHGVCL